MGSGNSTEDSKLSKGKSKYKDLEDRNMVHDYCRKDT